MKTIYSKQIGREILSAIDELDRTGEVPILINSNGEKFVIIKEKDYGGWCETAYLLSSLKNSKILQEALEEPLDECKDLKDVIEEQYIH